MAVQEFDVAIIGGGSAGYAAARTCGAAGLRTAIIEGGEKVGGLCILRGCMPTKAFLYAAEVVHLVKNSVVFGVRAGEVSFEWHDILARKNRLIQEFADYRQQQLENGKFQFIRARAWFTDPYTLRLSTGDHLRAKNFVIATGSVIAPSPLEALNEVGSITSDEAVDLQKLPRSLIVLGGGSVSVEFAQFFARLGVRVTLIQRSAHILKDEDADAAHVVETVFRREGITVFTQTNLLHAWTEGNLKGVSFEYEGQT